MPRTISDFLMGLGLLLGLIFTSTRTLHVVYSVLPADSTLAGIVFLVFSEGGVLLWEHLSHRKGGNSLQRSLALIMLFLCIGLICLTTFEDLTSVIDHQTVNASAKYIVVGFVLVFMVAAFLYRHLSTEVQKIIQYETYEEMQQPKGVVSVEEDRNTEDDIMALPAAALEEAKGFFTKRGRGRPKKLQEEKIQD